MISVIAAYAHGRVIGCAGQIPWNIPEDRTRFRELTTGQVVVMGRRTYEEIGRPLPNRETILVSSTLCVEQEHCTTVAHLRDALECAAGRDVFICGGERLYQEAMPFADRLYLTEIDADIAGDRYFPSFPKKDYILLEEQKMDGTIPFVFRTYDRRPMTTEQAQEYLRDITRQSGMILGLEPLKELLARLGNPQNQTRFLHIAGTNGKGSVGAMLRTILTRAGYLVGQYSSPAVFDPFEPWRIGEETISPKEYAALVSRIQRQRDAMLREGKAAPTAFEIETALAFLYFAEHHCDMAVLECGMGGREDATNVIDTTLLSLLTSIGLDHTRFLGDTIAEIAKIKGGILRSGVPVVMQGQSEEAERVVRALCCEQNCPLILIRNEEVLPIRMDWDGATFRYDGEEWHTSLTGSWQMSNAVQAIAAVRALRDVGVGVEDAAIREGLREVRWGGRLETICRSPRVVLDGAHNPNAVRRLCETLREMKREDIPLILVMGVLADKDYDEIAAEIAPLAEVVYTVTPKNPRALDAEKLAECVRQYHSSVHACSMREAAERAMRDAGAQGTVVAMGSLSYLQEFRCCVQAIKE